MKRALKTAGYLIKSLNFALLIALVAYWQSLRKVLTVQTEWVLAALFGILALVDAARAFERERNPDAEKPPVKKPREFVKDSSAILELARLNGFEAFKAFSPYLRKWMEIRGRFDGMAKSLEDHSIHASLILEDGRRINLRFAPEWKDRLHALEPGQRITAIGQIPYRHSPFAPENCEIVKIEPLRQRETQYRAALKGLVSCDIIQN